MTREIKKKKARPPCPTRELLDRVGDKWSVLLIVVLSEKPNHKSRFSELKRSIEGISQRMLTTTLRNLERDGFLKRYFYSEIPPRVEYELTPLGMSILTILKSLKNWVEDNWIKICNARGKFDSQKTKNLI